jgi:hypothetical protein
MYSIPEAMPMTTATHPDSVPLGQGLNEPMSDRTQRTKSPAGTAFKPTPLCAVQTANFPALLRQLGVSLLVTTDQADKLVMVRDEGNRLNTHFLTFQVRMGLAMGGGRVVALLRFDTTVQEIFAVRVLPGRRWPELINDDENLLENSFVVPDAALVDVPAALRPPAIPVPPLPETHGKRFEVCAQACG